MAAKIVKAVAPYIRKGIVNFKMEAYKAWCEVGGEAAEPHYLCQPFVSFFHNHELFGNFKFLMRQEARLRFVEPINRYFDAFPDYMFYEIIPMIWDCWPCLDDRLSVWLMKHDVKVSIFTSEQAAERIQKKFPKMKILVVPEGVNTSLYNKGKELKDRNIDVLEFGRSTKELLDERCFEDLNCICTAKLEKRLTDEELIHTMGDAKITLSLPKCDTDARIGDGQETLTQRYWENMLSRILMVGHAPKELVDLIGYNPCIELYDFKSHRGMKNYTIEPLNSELVNKQMKLIVENIEKYQDLVNKNRETALEMGDWRLRMRFIQNKLVELGYTL